ncbi:hypothetical protein AaE_016291, partial [Aphanomyces astaci]
MKVLCSLLGLLSAVAANTASLPDADHSALEQQLTKPNALYGPLAEANGFTPEAINSHTNLELSHETSLQGQTEAAENPVATFSEVNAPTDEDDLDCDDDDDNNNDNGDDDDNNNNDNGDDDDNNNNDNGN